ncbi:MAG TPA: TlpA disulfide reductase family protein [Chloroflexaceae bacterium]|nr:TlpA disulfide reductase family protein [Chloroflexaceae bacterium]
MEVLLALARLLLSGVFAISGLAKLADLGGTRESLRAFGAPGALVPALAIALPLGELALALMLIPDALAWWGAVGALALLALFTGAVGHALARGRRPRCHCFGQLSSRPIGPRTLLRNVALGALAAAVVAAGPGSLAAPIGLWARGVGAPQVFAAALLVALVGAVALQGWLIAMLLKQQGRLLLRIERLETRVSLEAPPESGAPPAPLPAHGLAPGTRAPGFQLSDLRGAPRLLPPPGLGGKPLLLVFVDPDCGPCHLLMPEIAEWQRAYGAALAVSVISRGSAEANAARFDRHGVANVLLQRDVEVAEAYRVQVTPSAVLLNPDGTVGSQVQAGAEAIRQLVEREVSTWMRPALTL